MLIKILGVMILYGTICLIEIPDLLNKKYVRELVIFLAFLLPAFILSLLIAVGIQLPRIIPAITSVFEPLIIWLGY